jgi:hypothetical protein
MSTMTYASGVLHYDPEPPALFHGYLGAPPAGEPGRGRWGFELRCVLWGQRLAWAERPDLLELPANRTVMISAAYEFPASRKERRRARSRGG